MRRTNSKKSLILQPPPGFRTSRTDGVITLSDGTYMRPDSAGLYHLDHAHVHLLPRFRGSGLARSTPGDVNVRVRGLGALPLEERLAEFGDYIDFIWRIFPDLSNTIQEIISQKARRSPNSHIEVPIAARFSVSWRPHGQSDILGAAVIQPTCEVATNSSHIASAIALLSAPRFSPQIEAFRPRCAPARARRVQLDTLVEQNSF